MVNTVNTVKWLEEFRWSNLYSWLLVQATYPNLQVFISFSNRSNLKKTYKKEKIVSSYLKKKKRKQTWKKELDTYHLFSF